MFDLFAEEDEKKDDDDDKSDNEDDKKPPRMVVEVYDLSEKKPKFVRQVHLMKTDDEPFIKDKNSEDFIKNSSFATNGTTLVLQTSTKAYFFDLHTGVRLQKGVKLGASDEKRKLCYDSINNVFYSFQVETETTKVEAFTISNFKKGEASFGFEKEYLRERINGTRKLLYGEPETGEQQEQSTLNIIQRIMKNVNTPDLIQ